MKLKKMSLASIQGKLSRVEMKNIMAGSGCAWTYSGCSYNESGYLTCDYTDCNGASHCGYQCMYPGDGNACR